MKCDTKSKRILFGSLDGRMFSIDAGSGQTDDGFGKAGWIDFRGGVADKFPKRDYGMSSPAVVYEDLVIREASLDLRRRSASGRVW